MKILHLISGGDTGGAKTHVLTLLKKLKQNGVCVKLLCVMDGDFAKEAKKNSIPTKIIHQAKRYDIKQIFKIKKYIQNEEFDLVHCHGARANFIALFIKKFLKIPFITTLHSDYKLDFNDNLYKKLIFTPINLIALKKLDYILTVTDSFRKMMIERNFDEQKLLTIYNGLDFKKVSNICPKDEFLKRYNLAFEKDKLYVGIVARLQAVKGINIFLEACKKLIFEKNVKNVVFLIAGSGDLKESIQKFIDKNNLSPYIHLLGFVNDVQSFYNLIDINVLTSFSESFPYVLLEGAKMKKPTVSTNVGGIYEMIKDGQNGFLVDAGDFDSLAKKIYVLINDKNIRDRFSQNLYDYCVKNFSDEKMAKTHQNIYKFILKGESVNETD